MYIITTCTQTEIILLYIIRLRREQQSNYKKENLKKPAPHRIGTYLCTIIIIISRAFDGFPRRLYYLQYIDRYSHNIIMCIKRSLYTLATQIALVVRESKLHVARIVCITHGKL